MVTLSKDNFHSDECEYIFDCENISLSEAIYTFCQDIGDNPTFEDEIGIGLINVMSKQKDYDRHPFGIQYCTIYDKDKTPSREFRFVDRENGKSLIPENVLDMRVIYLQKLRQVNKPNNYTLNIVLDSNSVIKQI